MRYFEVESYAEMSRKAANLISAQIICKPDSVLGLATGSSPIGTYKLLVDRFKSGDIDFSEITSVNLDEYIGLDPNNENSYRRFMNDNLFSHVNIDAARTFVPDGLAADTDAECQKYDERIKTLGGIDIQLLGIGLDGHIGFNEPCDHFEKSTHVVDLDESTITANARFFESREQVPRQAITMGMGAIMNAKKILLIANGYAKRDILNKAFYGGITPEVPASILQLHPDVTVIFSKQ
jgi:glucosamine-6-phosphate deaminase